MQDVLKQLGVRGYARERSPHSVRLIEELGEALPKPEHLKPKGFSDLDALIHGTGNACNN